MTVLAATAWPTNAELIADCARLGYLTREGVTLDATFGRGIWWARWWPETLIAHDIAMDGVDFRALPHGDNEFDAVAYDPPYVCVGGRDTTTIPDLHNRYGLTTTPKTPHGLQGMMNGGLHEMYRVVKPKGIVLAKCQSYVTSGKLFLGAHYTLTCAVNLGFEVVDIMQHVGHIRPQPGGRQQSHARNNYSTLYVLRKR